MTRNLKVLGLALAAVFALSAAIAASASAEIPASITADGSVTLVGDEIEGGIQNFFSGGGITIECPGSDITGHKVTVTPHEALPEQFTEVTITPVYTNCNHPIDMEGCDYRLYDATTTGGVAGTYGVKTDIVCPVNKKIIITVSPCNTLIGPQTGLTGLHLTNQAGSPNDLLLSGEMAVASTACGIPITAHWHQKVTVTGKNSAGEPTGITVTES